MRLGFEQKSAPPEINCTMYEQKSNFAAVRVQALNKVSRVLLWLLGMSRYSHPIKTSDLAWLYQNQIVGLRRQRGLICFALLAGLHTVRANACSLARVRARRAQE